MSGSRRPSDASCEAVLLLGFGGPTTAAEVRPFVDRVLAGRPVPRERYEAVVRHYESMGGRSPYNEITHRQATSLQDRLREMGIVLPVLVAFRHMPPFFDDTLSELQARGIGHALGFVLAPHRSEASWERYINEIAAARERLGRDAPEIQFPPLWHDHPAFVDAVSDCARAALERLPGDARENAALIFTAHSIPLSMPGRAAYVDQLNESARSVAEKLKRAKWTVAFQSRSGNPREPWLEPDIKDALQRLEVDATVVIPVGFLCDNVEILYDLDIDAAQVAREAGVWMQRAGTVNDHPRFIEMLAEITEDYFR